MSVLLGGGASTFFPEGGGGQRRDARALAAEFQKSGFDLGAHQDRPAGEAGAQRRPTAVLGLFHPRHMSVAFDKVGAGTYSKELALERNAAVRDQPMLDDMTRLALHSLSAHSPKGFYLIVEGASIDKQEHEQDAERVIWDTIEFDHAVKVALEFAATTNSDDDPANDTLVVVTADHESGGFAIVGVGNERYAPSVIGEATRDYAATLRFLPEQELNLFTNYTVDANGFPTDPDPTRKLLIGFAAGADRYENWVSNRLAQVGTVVPQGLKVCGGQPQARWPRAGGRQHHRRRQGDSGVPRRRHHRARRARLPHPGRLPRRYGGNAGGHRRAHRGRRAAVGAGPRAMAVHRHLREHQRVPEDAAGRGRQLSAARAVALGAADTIARDVALVAPRAAVAP